MSQSDQPESSPPIKAAQQALDSAYTSFTSQNPLSHEAFTNACSNLPGGNTRTVLHASPFPLTFSSASSCYLHSLDGDTYTDFLGEYTAGIYGHNHPVIRAAIDSALDSGWSFGGSNKYEKELARIVCSRFAPTMELVRFCNSGTEANMMAVAAAVAWTGRKKVLVFEKGYHGATLSFQAGPQNEEKQNIKNVNLPHKWVVAPYNDIEKTKEILSRLKPCSIGTIIVEPMLGSGGGIPASKQFLQFLRTFATATGAVLIFDEVMTSRLGFHGLGYEMGIRPDMMTLGKWVGGGMSFGAFGGRKDIMGLFDPRSRELAHAGTFNNNVVSMAAGIAGCKLLDEQRLAKLNDLGEQMKTMLQATVDKGLEVQGAASKESSNGIDTASRALEACQAPAKTELVDEGSQHHRHDINGKRMWVSGLGSILVVHFAASPVQSMLQSLFYHHMLSSRLYMAERGFMALSIEITLEQINAFTDATALFVLQRRNLILGITT